MTKTRDAKPGELQEIKILEALERLMKRPESRLDVQKMLERLSANGQTYVKHLVMSGPSSLLSAAKATGLKVKEVEEALVELDKGIQGIYQSSKL
jgi:hypothetical protein